MGLTCKLSATGRNGQRYVVEPDPAQLNCGPVKISTQCIRHHDLLGWGGSSGQVLEADDVVDAALRRNETGRPRARADFIVGFETSINISIYLVTRRDAKYVEILNSFLYHHIFIFSVTLCFYH